MTLNRKTKDTVFTKLFGEKKYALQLYKVFHPEDADATEDNLKIITINNVFTNGEHNDLGLIMNNRLMLFVESQSSWNGNMAIRALFYLTETYKRYMIDNGLDVMGKMPVTIPTPEVYVIFTGERIDKPEEMKLTNHFQSKNIASNSDKKSLELIVKMIYNSSEGDIVYQYINFCKVFNAQLALYPDNKELAIKETLRICMNKALLEEFINKHKSEVYDIMSDFVFNEELLMDIHIKSEIRLAREEALAEGKKEGRKQEKIETAKKLLTMGLTPEQISQATGLEIEQISNL